MLDFFFLRKIFWPSNTSKLRDSMPFKIFSWLPNMDKLQNFNMGKQPHQVTRAYVLKLFTSLPIKFLFICLFQRLSACLLGPPSVSCLWSEAAGWDLMLRYEDTWWLRMLKDTVSFCLVCTFSSRAFWLLTRDMENFLFHCLFPSSSPRLVAWLISHCSLGRICTKGGRKKCNLLLAIYNPLIWATKRKKKMQQNNLVSNYNTAILDQWSSMFLHMKTIF